MSLPVMNYNVSIPYTRTRTIIDKNTTIQVFDISNKPIKLRPIKIGDLILPDIDTISTDSLFADIVKEGYKHNLGIIYSELDKTFDRRYIYVNYIVIGFLLSTRVKQFNAPLIIFNEFTLQEFMNGNIIENIANKLNLQDDNILNGYSAYTKLKHFMLAHGVIKRVPVNEIFIDIDFRTVDGYSKSLKHRIVKILLSIIYGMLHDKLVRYGDVKYYITPSNNIRIIIRINDYNVEEELFNYAYYELANKNLYKYKKIIHTPYLIGDNIESLKINSKSELYENRGWRQKALAKKEINKLFFDLFRTLQSLSRLIKSPNDIADSNDSSSYIVYDFVNTIEYQYIVSTITLLKFRNKIHSYSNAIYYMITVSEDELKNVQLKTADINMVLEYIDFNNLYYTVSSNAKINNIDGLYTARVKVDHLNRQAQIDLRNIHKHTLRILNNNNYPEFYNIVSLDNIL